MLRRPGWRRWVRLPRFWSGGGLGGLGSGLGLVGLGGRVLAGAFGLEDGGVEDAVAAVGAFGEGLGIVFEGIRGRLGAFVADFESAAGGGFGGVAFEFVEHEVDVGAVVLDGAGLDEAFYAQLAVVGLVAHAA